jgi:predicted enzyme related to lactoylglutathione lyase
MVKEIDVSVSFYESIGFTLKNRWGNHYAQLSAPGLIIGLHPIETNGMNGSGNISIGFTTENFEESEALLKKLLIKAEERIEEGGRFLHFADPDGTQLYFINPKR